MRPLVRPRSQAGATSGPGHEDGPPEGSVTQPGRSTLLTPSVSQGTVSGSSPGSAEGQHQASGLAGWPCRRPPLFPGQPPGYRGRVPLRGLGTGPVSVAWRLDPGRCWPCWSSKLFCHCGWYGPTPHFRMKPCTYGLGTWSGLTGSIMSPFPTSPRTSLARPSSIPRLGPSRTALEA